MFYLTKLTHLVKYPTLNFKFRIKVTFKIRVRFSVRIRFKGQYYDEN